MDINTQSENDKSKTLEIIEPLKPIGLEYPYSVVKKPLNVISNTI